MQVTWLQDVTTGATGATAITPKFSDCLTLLQSESIAEVTPKISSWLHLCLEMKNNC